MPGGLWVVLAARLLGVVGVVLLGTVGVSEGLSVVHAEGSVDVVRVVLFGADMFYLKNILKK